MEIGDKGVDIFEFIAWGNEDVGFARIRFSLGGFKASNSGRADSDDATAVFTGLGNEVAGFLRDFDALRVHVMAARVFVVFGAQGLKCACADMEGDVCGVNPSGFKGV